MNTRSEPAPEPSTPLSPPVDAQVAAAGKRPRRPAPRRKPSKGTLFVALAAALLFVPLAVWLANQSPPRVTHAEAINLALAIEQANDLPALQLLVHFEDAAGAPTDPFQRPGDASPQLATQILFAKSKGNYTRLDMHRDTAGETLMFRCTSDNVLFDYHELRLERRDDGIKVCDLWSMRLGGWTRELLQERREILDSKEHATAAANFLQQVDELNPERLETAFQALHRSLRTSRCIGLLYLTKMAPHNFLAFRVAFAEFRSENPDNLAADALLLGAATAEVPRQEMIGAFSRIHARVGDDGYLAQLRALLVR